MTDIKTALIISIFIHVAFFSAATLFTRKPSKIYYVPIQLIGAGSSVSVGGGPSAGKSQGAAAVAEKAKAETVKSGEIVAAKTGRNRKKRKTVKKNEEAVKWEEKPKASAGSGAEPSKTGSAQASGTGEGTGTGSGSGAGLSVDAGNFPYPGYLNVIRNKVGDNWLPAPYAYSGSRKVLVYFNISRTGIVDKLVVKESSGVSYLDRSALRAIKSSSPFPPLPAGFPDNSLGVYFMFELAGS
jgi:TonB family protein